MSEHKEPVIRVCDISKSFSGVKVLKNVSFELYPGEVHALVGENGAGKSTLMKIMCGVHQPSSGEIFVGGKEVNINSPHDARDLGISLIHQEPLTFPDLDVTENIFVGHTRQDKGVYIKWPAKYKEARRLLDSLGVKLNERTRVKGMSIADQQMVEVISALSQNARVIVMDEPTAAITSEEVKTLFKIIRLLKEQGRAIVFISHRLIEVKEIADRVTVLRDGEKIATCVTSEVSEDDIIKMMIGRSLTEQIKKEHSDIGENLLAVKNISLPGKFHNISMEVKKGEIVGLAGLVGSGRSEVARGIFGITPPANGQIMVSGKEVKIKSPSDAIKHKIAYVPEDRAQQGLFLPFTISLNMTYAIPQTISKFGGWLKFKTEKCLVKDFSGKLRVKMNNERQSVKELSGGNQQKVVLAKWLLTSPDILILDEPTRGIDVGAKAEVYHLINELSAQGKGILMISSELPEIMGLSDRVYVMKEGKISGQFTRSEASDEKIMAAAASGKA